tara:strand:+ start:638 stop:2836 length:2199 start_codon:yes stop_codon:yes gene_type:complete
MSFSDYSKLTAIFAIVFTLGLSASFSDYAFANEASSITTPFNATTFTTTSLSNSTIVELRQDTIGTLKGNTTYVMAYSGEDFDGFITTYNVTADGKVTTLATLEHDTDIAHDNVLIDLDNDATLNCANNLRGCVETFVLFYGGTAHHGFVSTFNITDAGDIIAIKAADAGATNIKFDDTGPVSHISALKYIEGACSTGGLHCANFTYTHTGASGDGFIGTVNVNASGFVRGLQTEATTTHLEHDTGDASHPSLAAINAANVTLAYTGTGGDGFISTFNINSTGQIRGIMTDANGRALEHDTVNALGNSLIAVNGTDIEAGSPSSTTFALSYGSGSGAGKLSTFTVNQTGIVTLVNTASNGNALTYDPTGVTDTTLFTIDSTLDHYGVANNGGDVNTFDISDNGVTVSKIASANTGVSTGNTAILSVGYDGNFVVATSSGNGVTAGNIYILKITTESLSTSPYANLGCYDCVPPKLKSAEISIESNDYSVNSDNDHLEITANVGDEATIILQITDNKDINAIRGAGVYTNYQDRPDDMNLYYANNYDSSSYASNVDDVSTSFYQWNSRIADVAFDQLGSIIWNPVSAIFTDEPTTAENRAYVNDAGVVEVVTIPFTMTFNGPIESSEVWVEGIDAAGNHFEIQLPVTLTVVGDAPLNFDGGEQKLLAFFTKSYLSSMLLDWNTSSGDVEELSTVLGIPDEKLPTWTTNLATWVTDDKIDVADMIVAVEHIINQ